MVSLVESIRTEDDKALLTLSADLVAVLEPLAKREGLPVPAFISVLINEALGLRLLRRPFKPSN